MQARACIPTVRLGILQGIELPLLEFCLAVLTDRNGLFGADRIPVIGAVDAERFRKGRQQF